MARIDPVDLEQAIEALAHRIAELEERPEAVSEAAAQARTTIITTKGEVEKPAEGIGAWTAFASESPNVVQDSALQVPAWRTLLGKAAIELRGGFIVAAGREVGSGGVIASLGAAQKPLTNKVAFSMVSSQGEGNPLVSFQLEIDNNGSLFPVCAAPLKTGVRFALDGLIYNLS